MFTYKHYFLFLYFLCASINIHGIANPRTAEASGKSYECQKCATDIQALKKENTELKASEKSLRDEVMKYMKMYYDAREDAINLVAKWIGIATELANKIIGHSVRMSKL